MRKDANTVKSWKKLRAGIVCKGIEVVAIYPEESSWSGPGLNYPQKPTDEIAFRDYKKGEWSSCNAAAFIKRLKRR